MTLGDNPERMGYAIRLLPKTFTLSQAGMPLKRAALFGQHLYPKGCSKFITITEGREDALAAYEMMDSKWPVVSVTMGADNAVNDIKRNLEYLESFERVYLCFDADKPGHAAAIACANVLSPGKSRVVRLDVGLKDACGYSNPKVNKREEFVRAWWNASAYTPAGILTGEAVADRIKTRVDKPSLPYPYEGLNKLTYGIRTGEAVVIHAATGVGKTNLLREIERSILEHDPEAKIGTLFLEESPEDSGLGLMSVFADLPLHLPDTECPTEVYEEAERVLRSNRVYFFDAFGSNKIDEIIARVRYYVKGLGCRYVILDHLSIIVSDQMEGDERKLLDSMMTRLKALTMELDMALIAVVHENRDGKIRGTQGIEQLANIVIALDRDVLNSDPIIRNTTSIKVVKNRFCGRTGPACLARYDEQTGRSKEVIDQTFRITEAEIEHVFGSDEDIQVEIINEP
jgi:twinkle protein